MEKDTTAEKMGNWFEQVLTKEDIRMSTKHIRYEMALNLTDSNTNANWSHWNPPTQTWLKLGVT